MRYQRTLICVQSLSSLLTDLFMASEPKPLDITRPNYVPLTIMTTEGEQKVFLIEPHSPYYLHPAEGPGALITAVVFDGKNYDLWAKAVRTALKSKNKLGFIDGSITKSKPK